MSEETFAHIGENDIEDGQDMLFKDSFLTLLGEENIQKMFLRFFSCKENSFILFRDLFAFGNITKKQIEFINQKFPPERVKEFLQKIQEERQAKKIPAVLQNIIYKYIIQYYTILLSRYSILLTLDEPESEGMICEYREEDFSIWYCEVSGNTFLNVGNRMYRAIEEIEADYDMDKENDQIKISHFVFGNSQNTFIFEVDEQKLHTLEGGFQDYYEGNNQQALVSKKVSGGKRYLDIYFFDENKTYTFILNRRCEFDGVSEIQGEKVLLYSAIEVRESFLKAQKEGKSIPHHASEIYHYIFGLDSNTIKAQYLGDIQNIYDIGKDTIVEVDEEVDVNRIDGSPQPGESLSKKAFYSIQEDRFLFRSDIKTEIEKYVSSDDVVIVFWDNSYKTKIILSLGQRLSMPHVSEIMSVEVHQGSLDIVYKTSQGKYKAFNSGLSYSPNGSMTGKKH